ncbi:unnamed protein product [Prunus armeniaca]
MRLVRSSPHWAKGHRLTIGVNDSAGTWALSKCLLSQRPRTGVIAADASMDLLEDVVPLFCNDVLEISTISCGLRPCHLAECPSSVREDRGRLSVSIPYDTYWRIDRAWLCQDFYGNLPPNFIVYGRSQSCQSVGVTILNPWYLPNLVGRIFFEVADGCR